MINLIKSLAVIIFIALVTGAQAQVNFGIKAGLNLNNISQDFEDGVDEIDTKSKVGYHVGVVLDVPLSDVLSLQPGLLFNSKGYSVDLDEEFGDGVSDDSYYRSSFNYLEVPVHVAYKIDAFQIYAGPYVAFGVGGKSKYKYKLDGADEDESDDFKNKPVFGEITEEESLDDEKQYYNAFDAGINFGLGYQTGPVLINAGYSLGLVNMLPQVKGEDSDNKISNRVLSLSVSYLFGN